MKVNKNYKYDPIIDNKYYISENEYMNIKKKSDYGYILKNKNKEFYYVGDYSSQGFIFKDYSNYESGEGVCYIPEHAFPIINAVYSWVGSDNSYEEGVYRRNDIYDLVRTELLSDEYSGNFKEEDLPLGLVEHISNIVFDIIDWQFPESYLQGTDWSEEIIEYFKNDKEDLEEYASEELKNELEEQEVVYG